VLVKESTDAALIPLLKFFLSQFFSPYPIHVIRFIKLVIHLEESNRWVRITYFFLEAIGSIWITVRENV
jgi:hypothetical protein